MPGWTAFLRRTSVDEVCRKMGISEATESARQCGLQAALTISEEPVVPTSEVRNRVQGHLGG